MSDKPKDSEQFNIPDQGGVPSNPNDVNKLVDNQNTAEKHVNLPDSKVDEVKKQAADTTKANASKADENMVDSINSDDAGFKGKSVANVFKSISGPSPVKSSSFQPLLRGIPHITGADDEVRISDVDKQDRNLAMAEAMYDSVQSEIIEEGVKGTSNSDEAIIGEPSDVNVYSEQTTIAAESAVRRTKKYSMYDYRHRSSGTAFHRGSFVLSVSGDYIDLESDSEGNLSYDGHAAKKDKSRKENLLFNRLAADGGYIPNQFIMPKTGFFLVKGINPTPVTSPLNLVGKVKRKVANGYQLAEVYQATSNGIFEVEDVTPLMSDFLQAGAKTVELLTCNKSKMQLGMAEQLANSLIELADKIDNRELIKYPETNLYRNRSSLYSIKGISSLDTGLDCLNNIEQYIEFMNALCESEIMHIVPRLNVLNIKNNLKWMKGFEGMQLKNTSKDLSYWKNVIKAYPSNANVSTPTLAAYCSTMASPHRYNRPAALLYGMRELWAKIESQCLLMDEGDIKTSILDRVYVATDILDQLTAKLSCGMIADPSTATSDARIEMADVGQFILHFDPNDLLDYSGEFISSGKNLDYRCSVYPSAGYVNVYTGAGGYAAEVAVYNVIPTWMETIAKIISSPRAKNRLLRYRDTTVVDNVMLNMLQYCFSVKEDNAKKFLPWNIDTFIDSWISHWYLDGLMEVQHDVLSNKNQRSGYFRYLAMLDEITGKEVYTDGKVSVGTILTSLINNDYIKADEFRRTASDFKQLSPDILKLKLEDIDDEQIGIFNYIDMSDYGSNFAEHDSVVVFNPSKFDRHVSDLEGWQVLVPSDHGHVGTTEVSATNIHELIAGLPTTNSSGAAGMRFWPNKSDNGAYLSSVDGFTKYQILLWNKEGNDQKIPVVLKRKLDYIGSKTVAVGTNNANPYTLGFEDNPQNELYGRDSHINLPPVDGYFLLKRVPERYTSDGLVYDDNFATAEYFIAPFISIGSDLTGSDAWQKPKYVAHSYKALRSRDINSLNQLYDNDAVISPTTGAVTDETAHKITKLERSSGANGTYHYLCQPSLYGYNRVPAFYKLFTQNTTQAKYEPFVAAAGHNVPLAGYVPCGIFYRQSFFFFPQDFEWPNQDNGKADYATLANVNPHQYFNARFAVDVPAASDWKWYNWQKELYFHFVDAAMDADMITDQRNTVCTYLQKPIFRGDIFKTIDITNATEIKKESEFYTDTVGLNASIAYCEDDFGSAEARFAFDRYIQLFRDLYKQPESEPIRLVCAIVKVSNVKKPTFIFYRDLDDTKNPDLMSKLVYNDYRVYRTDRPIIRLNQDWNSIGMTRSLVYEQFKK